MARTKSTTETIRLVPTITAFDFLDGSFADTQKARRISLGIAVGALAILVVFALLGAQALLKVQSGQAQMVQLQAANAQAGAELTKIDNYQGISATELSTHVSERNGVRKEALSSEIDTAALTRNILNASPTGVDVSAITFHDAASATPAAAPPAAGEGESSGAAPAPATPAAPANHDEIGSVEIKATMKNFDLLGSWGRAVGAVPGLVAADPTWQSSTGSVTATLSLTINRDGLTTRAKSAGGK